MGKIKVVNVKTGKVSEITMVAWELMKKTRQTKDFDIIDESKPTKIGMKKTSNESPKKKAVEKIVEIESSKPETQIESEQGEQETNEKQSI